jgi:predicted phosphodiesterase
MLKIAVFSDVHGNLPALNAILEDVKRRGIDEVYCLGDLVDFAPWPNEVIGLIEEFQIPCLLGNHDERVAFDHSIEPLAKHSAEETAARIIAINHTKKILTPHNKAFLSRLPRHLPLKFKAGQKEWSVLLVHGSIRSNDEYIYEDHPHADVSDMLHTANADVLIMGHTHVPYIRKVLRPATQPTGMAINCGSVGRSKEATPYATYLVLNIDETLIVPEIVRLKYNLTETIEAIEKSDIPDYYAAFFKGIGEVDLE